jgi:hypothetical protein
MTSTKGELPPLFPRIMFSPSLKDFPMVVPCDPDESILDDISYVSDITEEDINQGNDQKEMEFGEESDQNKEIVDHETASTEMNFSLSSTETLTKRSNTSEESHDFPACKRQCF